MARSSKVPAADNALRILTLLAASRAPLPATVIAMRLGLPRSSVYHLLTVLEERDFVMHLSGEHLFGLGPAVVELSGAYTRQEPLTRVGRTAIAALVDRTGVSAHLAVLQGTDVLYIVEERAPHSPYLVTDVDVRLPAESTASGRAMLAQLPPAQLRALYPDRAAFARGSSAGRRVGGYAELRALLRDTADRGYGTEDGDVTPGFASVAVPVLDHRGWPVAGLALTFRGAEVDAGMRERLVAEARATAAEIARRIHGRPPTPRADAV